MKMLTFIIRKRKIKTQQGTVCIVIFRLKNKGLTLSQIRGDLLPNLCLVKDMWKSAVILSTISFEYCTITSGGCQVLGVTGHLWFCNIAVLPEKERVPCKKMSNKLLLQKPCCAMSWERVTSYVKTRSPQRYATFKIEKGIFLKYMAFPAKSYSTHAIVHSEYLADVFQMSRRQKYACITLSAGHIKKSKNMCLTS